MLPQNPEMLFSYLNLQLRDHYSSLEELCDGLNEDQASILAILKNAGYEYNSEKNAIVATQNFVRKITSD
ncbi:MAG: DUF4250 domain-containing protein [Lachnospiraceae bacterium]